jgi:hypothetical protein
MRIAARKRHVFRAAFLLAALNRAKGCTGKEKSILDFRRNARDHPLA